MELKKKYNHLRQMSYSSCRLEIKVKFLVTSKKMNSGLKKK